MPSFIRRRWIETIRDAVGRELDAGTPVPEIAGRLDFPEFAHLRGYKEQLPAFVVRMAQFHEMGW